MDLEETIDYVKQFYKQEIKYSYDDSCISKIEINFKDGQIFPQAIITYNRVNLAPKNQDSFYVRLAKSQEKVSIKNIKDKLSLPIILEESQIEALRHASVLKNLNRPENGFEDLLQNLIVFTGLSREEILKKAGL